MSKFNVRQKVYLPNGHEGIIIKVLDNDCYLVRENGTETEYELREDMISKSKYDYPIRLTVSKLSKMKKLKSYREKYDIYQSNGNNIPLEFNPPISFPNGTRVIINWNILISKFEIIAIDCNCNNHFGFIIPNLGFDIYDNKYICDTEEEIIDVLEATRTQIEIKNLKPGDIFVCYDTDGVTMKPYMLVTLGQFKCAVCLLDGTCFDISSMMNSEADYYASKLDNPFLNKTNQIY